LSLAAPFVSLRNPRFARLYAAQAVSLIGDALTWVALALLAFELAGEASAAVLGTALTMRVLAFVALSPLAGVIADRFDRKFILVACDLGRAAVIAAMPFVRELWQLYLLVFVLNALTAFFTPTNQATVPLVTGRDDAASAFALSSATTEVVGIAGPALAGTVAALFGGRSLFAIDAATFLLSGLLILTLPGKLRAGGEEAAVSTWHGIRDGTTRLWADPPVRLAVLMELVASVAGALVLVGTVQHVKGALSLGDAPFGLVMAAYGAGATLASLVVGSMGRRVPRTTFVVLGALLTSLAVLPANLVGFAALLPLWVLAGAGQNWVNLPTETLLAERTPTEAQGRVYGAHFAWSHLWWAFAYPLAGWLGGTFPERSFLYGGLVGLALLVVLALPHLRASRATA
jgi:NRE family putative nickel resistance protein-like MFS transporter